MVALPSPSHSERTYHDAIYVLPFCYKKSQSECEIELVSAHYIGLTSSGRRFQTHFKPFKAVTERILQQFDSGGEDMGKSSFGSISPRQLQISENGREDIIITTCVRLR